MTLQVLAFGAAQDAMGGKVVQVQLKDSKLTVAKLKTVLISKFPELQQLTNFLIAVNASYAYDEDRLISAGDEVAVIPPTSGG